MPTSVELMHRIASEIFALADFFASFIDLFMILFQWFAPGVRNGEAPFDMLPCALGFFRLSLFRGMHLGGLR